MIRSTLVAVALATLPAVPLAAQAPARDGGTTSLTIYNDGRVLVRRALPVAVPEGPSEHRVPLGPLDPGTLLSLDPAVAVLGAQYEGAADEESALRRAIGRDLAFLVLSDEGFTDTVTATVLGVAPLRLRMPDGRVTFSTPGIALYPAELVSAGPTATLSLQSESERDSLRLGYFTNGASWHASYDAILTGSNARVTGTAVIVSEGLSAANATVQLLAGDVGRAANGPMPMMARRDRAMEMAAVSGFAGEQSVGDYHLYTLPEPVTIVPGGSTSQALFAPTEVSYERRYIVRGGLPYYGILPRRGDQEEVPVQVTYNFERPRETEFGDRPLPMGAVRLYQPDSAGQLQLVGAAMVDHTPAGEAVELQAGTAFDLTARRVQRSYDTREEPVGQAGTRTIATAEYEVTLTNAGDSAVTVAVVEERAGDWEIVASSVPAERVSATRAEFAVEVPAGERQSLRYTVRATW